MEIGPWGYGIYSSIISKEDGKQVPTQIDTKDDLDIGNHYKALTPALPSKETLESAPETSFRPVIA
jgi:hypothetical protein